MCSQGVHLCAIFSWKTRWASWDGSQRIFDISTALHREPVCFQDVVQGRLLSRTSGVGGLPPTKSHDRTFFQIPRVSSFFGLFLGSIAGQPRPCLTFSGLDFDFSSSCSSNESQTRQCQCILFMASTIHPPRQERSPLQVSS